MKYCILTFLCVAYSLFSVLSAQEKVREFIPPDVPVMIFDKQAKVDYFIKHFWDNFDFSDTVYIHLPDITDQAIVDYIHLLPNVDNKTAFASIKNTLSKAETNQLVYNHFVKVLTDYTYTPGLPTYNEDYYAQVAEYILTDISSTLAEKERAKFNLEMAIKNKVGDVAMDFTYTLLNGKKNTLHQVDSPYLLLFFYNPDCSHCSNAISSLKKSPVVNNGIEIKSLTILSCYPGDDLNSWKRYLAVIPENWINCYDKDMLVERAKLYDLKAIPSIYLLDYNKQIVLKYPSVKEIENYLLERIR